MGAILGARCNRFYVAPKWLLPTLQSAKPSHGPKPIKLCGGRGLFLLLQPSGGKPWRLKCRFEGKEKRFGLGA